MEYKVLDHGSIEVYEVAGDELKIVNSARVSYGNRHTELDESDQGLINFLVKNRHGTPFEQVDFTFVIKCPISVAREWFRHRIASYNEVSGRYTILEPKFYMPEGDLIRTQVGKPGHYKYEPITEPRRVKLILKEMEEIYSLQYKSYRLLLAMGLAKEVARNVLGVGTYTEFFFKINARSLMNFLNLRNSDHAMKEFREYAILIEKIFEEKMPFTHEAFVMNGRNAP